MHAGSYRTRLTVLVYLFSPHMHTDPLVADVKDGQVWHSLSSTLSKSFMWLSYCNGIGDSMSACYFVNMKTTKSQMAYFRGISSSPPSLPPSLPRRMSSLVHGTTSGNVQRTGSKRTTALQIVHHAGETMPFLRG